MALRFKRVVGRATADREGSAAIEFAVVAPVLVLLVVGLVVYGGWFWLAQSVQSLAADGARAAIAGVDAAERSDLARTLVLREAGSGAGLDPARTVVSVSGDAETVAVSVAYDASDHPLLALAGLIPRPPTLIRRTAVVRLGGYA